VTFVCCDIVLFLSLGGCSTWSSYVGCVVGAYLMIGWVNISVVPFSYDVVVVR
jgi:hypothetical protein